MISFFACLSGLTARGEGFLASGSRLVKVRQFQCALDRWGRQAVRYGQASVLVEHPTIRLEVIQFKDSLRDENQHSWVTQFCQDLKRANEVALWVELSWENSRYEIRFPSSSFQE